jgi:hypothetical protein
MFDSAVQKRKYYNIQGYRFVCSSVWVWKLVSDIKGWTNTEGVLEQGAEEDIRTDEVYEGELRKLHNKELHDLYSSPCIIRIIKSKRMRLVNHVTRIGETMNAYRLLVGSQRERDR